MKSGVSAIKNNLKLKEPIWNTDKMNAAKIKNDVYKVEINSEIW